MTEDFISTLKEHGLMATYPRLAIYQTLFHTKEHLSAESIYERLQTGFSLNSISIKEVRKTLERFAKAGLVQKVSATKEVARYCVPE